MKRTLQSLFLVLVLSTSVVLMPRPAHALAVFDAANFIKNTLTSVMTSAISGVSSGISVKEYALDPIAWSLSQQMLKSVTGSVVGFVNGQSNGASGPQFVQDLSLYFRNVGDNQALAFFSQFTQNSNSPFASAIASSLRTNYAQQTSLAGFFAANRDTLPRYSSDPRAYLSGAWAKGGLGAWFALTTQNSSNPFILAQTANAQLYSLVSNTQAQQSQQLNWGQGFQPWCGNGSAPAPGSSSGQTNPVQCLNPDGSPGKVQTPGSVIVNAFNHTTGSNLDKVVSADEISEVAGQLAIGLVSNVLGGSSGGLFGLSQTSSSGASYINRFESESTTEAAGSVSSTSGAAKVAQTALDNVSAYNAVWTAVLGAANTASTSMSTLAQACPDQAATADTAISGQIAPVIQLAKSSIASTDATRALAFKVQSEAANVTTDNLSTLLADAERLAAMPPSAGDVALLQVNQQNQIDQMNAVTQSAASLRASCAVRGTSSDG